MRAEPSLNFMRYIGGELVYHNNKLKWVKRNQGGGCAEEITCEADAEASHTDCGLARVQVPHIAYMPILPKYRYHMLHIYLYPSTVQVPPDIDMHQIF